MLSGPRPPQIDVARERTCGTADNLGNLYDSTGVDMTMFDVTAALEGTAKRFVTCYRGKGAWRAT